jgi:hypothetical protein
MPNTERSDAASGELPLYGTRSTSLYLCIGHALGILTHPSVRVQLAREIAKDPVNLGQYVENLRNRLGEVLPGGTIDHAPED